jgi:hypothetical protein
MSEDPNRAEYDERGQALEADVKDLALLFKHLVDSSPHGWLMIEQNTIPLESTENAKRN